MKLRFLLKDRKKVSVSLLIPEDRKVLGFPVSYNVEFITLYPQAKGKTNQKSAGD